MDEQGIDRALMFPTLASLVEERLRDDPELTHAAVHALNQWMHETWTFDYEDRIFATPVITLPIVEKAIEELEWVVERGAKAVLIRPAPVPGYRGPRSFGLPEFDPVLGEGRRGRRARRHALLRQRLRALHQRVDGQRQRDAAVPAPGVPDARPVAARSRTPCRPVICHGALSRFPGLKVAVIENGSSWVEPLLRNLADVYKKMPQDFLEDPIEVFKRNIHVSPFWEEDLGALAELIGDERVLFGSDYPHPEGLAEPASYVDELAGVPDETVRKIMGGNLARLMNVEDAVVR